MKRIFSWFLCVNFKTPSSVQNCHEVNFKVEHYLLNFKNQVVWTKSFDVWSFKALKVFEKPWSVFGTCCGERKGEHLATDAPFWNNDHCHHHHFPNFSHLCNINLKLSALYCPEYDIHLAWEKTNFVLKNLHIPRFKALMSVRTLPCVYKCGICYDKMK